jgi:hypothetical protein
MTDFVRTTAATQKGHHAAGYKSECPDVSASFAILFFPVFEFLTESYYVSLVTKFGNFSNE